MLIGKVVDNVWATRKDEKLKGLKLMVVEVEGTDEGRGSRKMVATRRRTRRRPSPPPAGKMAARLRAE